MDTSCTNPHKEKDGFRSGNEEHVEDDDSLHARDDQNGDRPDRLTFFTGGAHDSVAPMRGGHELEAGRRTLMALPRG